MDGGFDDAVGADGEEGVGFLDAAEWVAVGYQMGCVDLPFGDELHDYFAVAGIDAAGLEREVLAVHPRQGQYLFLLIERDNRRWHSVERIAMRVQMYPHLRQPQSLGRRHGPLSMT